MPELQTERPKPTTADHELQVMENVYAAITMLDRPAQERALNWLTSRLGANWVRHDYPVDFEKEPPF